MPHGGGPPVPSPPWASQAPPSPTWRCQSLGDTAGLTWAVQGPSEQSSCWQRLSSWFPGLIGSGEGAGLAGPGRQPESRGGGGVSRACPPGPVWTQPSTFPLLSISVQADSARRPSDSEPAGLPEGPPALCLYFSEMGHLIRHHLEVLVSPSKLISGLPCLLRLCS